jgi:hypothetical protein
MHSITHILIVLGSFHIFKVISFNFHAHIWANSNHSKKLLHS